MKAKKALGKLDFLAFWLVYQLNSAGSSDTTGFSIKATAGCCLWNHFDVAQLVEAALTTQNLLESPRTGSHRRRFRRTVYVYKQNVVFPLSASSQALENGESLAGSIPLVSWSLWQAEKLPRLFRQEGGRRVWDAWEGRESVAEDELLFWQRFGPIRGQCQDHVH